MTDLFERPAVQEDSARASRVTHRERRAARRRRRRRRRTAIVLVSALVVMGGFGYWVARNVPDLFGIVNPVLQAKDYEGNGESPVTVTIEAGSTGSDMGRTLVDAGVVASTKAFTDAFEKNPDSGKIQPGTYALLTKMSAADAVTLLVANDKIEKKLTIPEGYTVEQILEKASSVTGIDKGAFQTAMKDAAATGLPSEAAGNYEGWLSPTTYILDDTDDASAIVAKMVKQTVLELDSAGVAPADRERVLTTASLIEREAKAAADRPKMAQAIQNRLDKGIPLGIDAAVAYGAGKPGTELTRDDTQNPDNPYNTYVHKGLPPGPIASPGRSSIDAVMHPEPGPWLFWTAINLDTGETRFATTMEEHLKNVALLRQWQEENGG